MRKLKREHEGVQGASSAAVSVHTRVRGEPTEPKCK